MAASSHGTPPIPTSEGLGDVRFALNLHERYPHPLQLACAFQLVPMPGGTFPIRVWWTGRVAGDKARNPMSAGARLGYLAGCGAASPSVPACKAGPLVHPMAEMAVPEWLPVYRDTRSPMLGGPVAV